MKRHKTSNLLLVVCPKCGKRVLHPKGESDPKKAVWCLLNCDDCEVSGNKDYNIAFFGEHGFINDILEGEAVEMKQIRSATKSNALINEILKIAYRVLPKKYVLDGNKLIEVHDELGELIETKLLK